MGRANHQSTPVCARVGTYAVQSLSKAEVAEGT
ncbi:Serine/threonine protein kinase [Giardia duodenalis]|uniref:Serine/threonine protein kinase n=1 Tax=Giardia intestinalis TaxID=5741 RepID=V6TNC6_GIAIN|nr:Serine/threonine protein kinase [Giardia intestinalis]